MTPRVVRQCDAAGPDKSGWLFEFNHLELSGDDHHGRGRVAAERCVEDAIHLEQSEQVVGEQQQRPGCKRPEQPPVPVPRALSIALASTGLRGRKDHLISDQPVWTEIKLPTIRLD